MAKTTNNLNTRVKQLRRDTDNIKNISISIDDIVRTIKNYIINDINPEVIENDLTRKVPVHYANPEAWKSIQKNGFLLDQKSGQVMVPTIVFKLSGISKNTDIPIDKLDGNLNIIVQTGWDKKNRYDSFTALNGIKPTNNFYSVMVPDYMKFSFDVNIWTGYVSHMNKIIEKFIYHEGTYWGDKNNYLFKCTIDNYNNIIEVDSDFGRAVRNSFTIEVNGYILPEYYKNKSTNIKRLDAGKIILNFEEEKILKLNDITNGKFK